MLCSNCRHAARMTLKTAATSQAQPSRSLFTFSTSLAPSLLRPLNNKSLPSTISNASRTVSLLSAFRRPSPLSQASGGSAATSSHSQTITPLIPSSISHQTSSFSSSASLQGLGQTFSPSRRIQKRRHGYLSRVRDRNKRKIIKRRTAKGRKNMSW